MHVKKDDIGPEINFEDAKDVQRRKPMHEDDDMEYNIQQISKLSRRFVAQAY